MTATTSAPMGAPLNAELNLVTFAATTAGGQSALGSVETARKEALKSVTMGTE